MLKRLCLLLLIAGALFMSAAPASAWGGRYRGGGFYVGGGRGGVYVRPVGRGYYGGYYGGNYGRPYYRPYYRPYTYAAPGYYGYYQTPGYYYNYNAYGYPSYVY